MTSSAQNTPKAQTRASPASSARDEFQSILDELFAEPGSVPYARCVEDWAMEVLEVCPRCLTRLGSHRVVNYCPHCGNALRSGLAAASGGESKSPGKSRQPAPAVATPPAAKNPTPPEPPMRNDHVLEVLNEWQRIRDTVSGTHASASVPAPPSVHVAMSGPATRIIEGYANALFRLGAYYESSMSSQNKSEAIRCYLKAARLGNAQALERLAPRCAG